MITCSNIVLMDWVVRRDSLPKPPSSLNLKRGWGKRHIPIFSNISYPEIMLIKKDKKNTCPFGMIKTNILFMINCWF